MKKHWFAFSYVGNNRNGSPGTAWSSTYTGYDRREVTLPMIQENKAYALVDDDATLLSVSYLGHMTHEEFLAKQDEADP